MLKIVYSCTNFTFYVYKFFEVNSFFKYRVLGNICDSCNSEFEKGFLFPSLNWGMCQECGLDYIKRNIFKIPYEEDFLFTERYKLHFEKIVPVTAKYTLPVLNCLENDFMLFDYITELFNSY